jgi:uncharacterized protein YegL
MSASAASTLGGSMADIVYPLYIVIDASASMNKEANGQKRIDLVRDLPLILLRLYEEDNSLVSSVQVAVATFNTEVNLIQKLGEIPKLRKLPLNFEAKSKTYFGEVFKSLLSIIDSDYKRLSGTSTFMKPTVVIFTDGGPNDDPTERNSAFRRLVPVNHLTNKPDKNLNPLWPQIVMFGIDVVNEKVLQAYSHKNTDYYKASDSISIEDQFRAIANKLKDSVTSSVNEPVMDPEEPWFGIVGDDDDDILLL